MYDFPSFFSTGEKVAKFLDKKLAQYKERRGSVDECEDDEPSPPGRGKKKRKKEGSSSKEDACDGSGPSEISTPKSKVRNETYHALKHLQYMHRGGNRLVLESMYPSIALVRTPF